MTSKTISIIVPARDEEIHLPMCLKSIDLASKGLKIEREIIVVLNRCTDRTEQIARAAGCKVVNCDAKNLASIRNAGAKAAQGEILLTLDADSRMSKNCLKKILLALESEKYIGGGVWIVPERLSLGIFLTGLMILPKIIRHGVLCGLFFCKKADFDAIGGFNEKLASVEDIDFAIRLKRYGKSIGKKYKNFFLAYITTSCRKFDHFGDWYFVKRPKLVKDLLKGGTQKDADRIWYEFPRE